MTVTLPDFISALGSISSKGVSDRGCKRCSEKQLVHAFTATASPCRAKHISQDIGPTSFSGDQVVIQPLVTSYIPNNIQAAPMIQINVAARLLKRHSPSRWQPSVESCPFPVPSDHHGLPRGTPNHLSASLVLRSGPQASCRHLAQYCLNSCGTSG